MKIHAWVYMISRVWLFVTPWTVACQALLSMEFFRQEYWSVLQCPCLGYLPNPGIEYRSLILQVDSLPFELPRNPSEYYHEHLMSALLKYFSNTYIFSQVFWSELNIRYLLKTEFSHNYSYLYLNFISFMIQITGFPIGLNSFKTYILNYCYWLKNIPSVFITPSVTTQEEFSSVAQSCLTLWDSWIAAGQASLSITNSQSSPKLMCIESVMPPSHLILCCPLLQSSPASVSFPMNQLIASGSQSIGASASAWVIGKDPDAGKDWG